MVWQVRLRRYPLFATMLNCHCRDCQRATGTAYAAAFAIFPKSAVSLKGKPCWYRVIGSSGKPIERGFCGNPMTVRLDVAPDIIGFHAASLDGPARYKPAVDLFTASAHPWYLMQADTIKKAGGLAS